MDTRLRIDYSANVRAVSKIVGALVVIVILAVGIILAGIVFNHAKTPSTTQSTTSETSTSSSSTLTSSCQASCQLRGVTFTPLSYDASGTNSYFQWASSLGVVSWAGDWEQLGIANGSPAQIAQLAHSHNLKVMIEAQFFTQSSGQLLRPLDQATVTNYTNMASSFAKLYQPEYMAFGIEINTLYEKSPSDYQTFVSSFNQVYSAVKTASPHTVVFTIFQLERMAGLQGGLYGGSNNATAEWSLIGQFNMDAVGFTTYPDLVFKDPSAIPSDFYTQIENHTSLPVIFTEVGWHSAAEPSGWESSPQEQAQFVSTFFALTATLNPEVSVWSFLYDQNTAVPFNSMGLVDANGTARPAWNAWIAG